ncbi:MAG: LptF/LptG family permease [Verrucomicrobia bacterium]|nr:LptF/LptG family permease [Verrucomicrobiota bacterium]
MGVLHNYISRDFLITFGMSVLILTFVMCVGAGVQAIDLLARGVSAGTILLFFLHNIPFMLMFTLPMSVLVGVLLLFSRLSLDGEITAMKSCGVSLWQIVSPLIMISIALCFLCFYISGWVAPHQSYARRTLLARIGIEDPTDLLEEGRFTREFPGMMVYVGKKDKDKVSDIVVYEMTDDGKVALNIRAKRGVLRPAEEEALLHIDLYDVRIDRPDEQDPLDPAKSQSVIAEHYPVTLDFSKLTSKGFVKKKAKDMTLPELIQGIRNVRALYPELAELDMVKHRTRMLVAANKRLTLSLSCFAFTLFGIPLGLRSRRKESSVGIAISLLIVFFYYLFTIAADSMVEHPDWRPDLILWFPVIAMEVVGFYLLFRNR